MDRTPRRRFHPLRPCYPIGHKERRLSWRRLRRASAWRSPAVSDKTSSHAGEVLRLRNLVMIENIGRAEDPAWRDRLERQQVWPGSAGCSAQRQPARGDFRLRRPPATRAAGSALSYAPGWPTWRDGRLSGVHAPAAPDAGRNSWKPGSTAQAQRIAAAARPDYSKPDPVAGAARGRLARLMMPGPVVRQRPASDSVKGRVSFSALCRLSLNSLRQAAMGACAMRLRS